MEGTLREFALAVLCMVERLHDKELTRDERTEIYNALVSVEHSLDLFRQVLQMKPVSMAPAVIGAWPEEDA